MEINKQIKPPLIPFLVAAMAPVVAFVLANALFLPYILALMNFGNSFLAKLIPNNVPESSYLVIAFLVLLFPILAAAVLLGPALTSFILNLRFPILVNWPSAFWSGVVFFFFHLIILTILLLVRNVPLFPTPDPNYPITPPWINPIIPIDPLAIAGLLAGLVLSGSVSTFGWLGARMKRKKTNLITL
jgi:hypothetical protein